MPRSLPGRPPGPAAGIEEVPTTDRIVLGRVVTLDRVSPGGYEAYCHGGWVHTRAYGGAVLAHGVAAAADSIAPGRGLDSLHAYFIAAVDPAAPLHYAVVPLREGRSYSVCRVDAVQEGRQVFTMTTSFKRPEGAARVRRPEPPAGIRPPEECPDGFAERGPDSPIAKVLENREAGELAGADVGELRRANWMRLRHPLGNDAAAQTAALVYLSDVTLAPTAFGVEIGQRRPEGSVIASLDHALWLHHDPAGVRADDWLLFVQSSRLQEDGRTFARGELWSRDGVLVASAAQEALIRHLEPAGNGVPTTTN